ncbi:MAG: PHP domain-containing protein, partial [Calditrichaeota bacterium]
MNKTVLVNFHCHSIFSDGDQTPEILASNLAAAGVRYAALTDHDSIEGLPRFQEALKKRGIAHLPGVEITTQFKGREAHLLAYGFDPKDTDLAVTLLALRQRRDWQVHSIADAMRKKGSNHHNQSTDTSAKSAAATGRLDIDEAIAIVHRAGGRAFLAHPLNFESDPQALENCVIELKTMGLDGVEAFYAPYSAVDCDALYQLAERHDLLVSAGTDFHSSGDQNYGIEMPPDTWIKFRRAVFSSSTFSADTVSAADPLSSAQSGHASPGFRSPLLRRRSFVLRIFLPTLFAILLFLTAIWGFMLPSFEQSLLERKRELIHELTNSAWSILASYERDVQHGLVTREQAQAMASARIEALRYGPEGKDYFWIQDMEPRMIMHPYRSELNGKELHNFTDPRGIRIFVEFADRVRR